MREEAAGYAAPAGPGGGRTGPRRDGVGRMEREAAGWASRGWVSGLSLGFGFWVFFLFLFLIQTKFEFKLKFEFKPHSNN